MRLTRALLGIFLATVVATVVAACGTTGNSSTVSLPGTNWRLASLTGKNALPSPPVTLLFDAKDKMSGSDGCNSYQGTYKIDGDKVSFLLGPSTRMACSQEIQSQANLFLTALIATARYSVSGDTLTLKDGARSQLATLGTLSPTSLSGTQWQATSYNNGKGAVVSVVPGSSITALFGTDGKLTGNDGCNNYNASYSTDGNKITIGAPASQRQACPQPQFDQETQYLDALTKATTFALSATTLELRDSGGALMVSYKLP